ncbi:AGXT2 [Lepeophtheirus salmonis]|uniref:Alanine--glyoxylate aminotransferase 2, mitochondrial n=1 Tax=Lepeophtheirus salmonis TaxID=72036 RepID=A0A7R8D2J9_LEPSM|nr:AGXT2 [Lepeophtheirus salmonis]CAF2975238.1 AGXT2 [Lepeophtheirus salmonis]
MKLTNSLLGKLPAYAVTPKPHSGPSFESVHATRKTKLNPALTTNFSSPLYITQGSMQWLWDSEGKRYLDLFGGIVTVSVGHCHPKVNKALEEQLSTLWHTTNIYYHPKIHEYVERLTSTLPEHLCCAYFVNSGSEANDLAMYMARLHTKNYDIISYRNAYHGMSPYTMGLTAHSPWKFPLYTGSEILLLRHSEIVPVIRKDLGGKVAALFAESIQGVGGAVQFPKGYLKKAVEKIRLWGGLYVADEVQTGFGRTGTHFWGFEGHGVSPDIVTMAKGIGNGFPMAAIVTTKEVAASMSQATHFNTFGGNPMASTVGMAVLDAIEEDGCQENSHKTGSYFIKELEKLREEFEIVGDVRGKGLMIGMEMVEDKKSKTPLNPNKIMQLWDGFKDGSVIVGRGGLAGNVFRFKPPMCINKEDVDFAIHVMRDVLSKTQ